LLETLVRRAPLGLRCLDLARGTPVVDGLAVSARPLGGQGPPLTALRSPVSGVYGFRTLPGLRRYERDERPATDWCASPPDVGEPTAEELADLGTLQALVDADAGGPSANFAITIEDALGRFLPQAFLLCVPKEHLIEVPLFSAPARGGVSGMAAVRGEVWEWSRQQPAAWAVVTASPAPAATYVAIADARGMFALFVPYASALPPLVGSPPHGSVAVDQLAWPLTVQVLYQPASQHTVPGLEPPDSRSILEQPGAVVYDALGLGGAAIVRQLRLGEDLVVTTAGQARLLVDPV
jgi:hypothetical protein